MPNWDGVGQFILLKLRVFLAEFEKCHTKCSLQCFCLAKSLGRKKPLHQHSGFLYNTKGREQLLQLKSLETDWVTRGMLVGKHRCNPTGTHCEYKLPNRSLNSILRESAEGTWEASTSTAAGTNLQVELHCHVPTLLLMLIIAHRAEGGCASSSTHPSPPLFPESLDERQQIFWDLTSLPRFSLLRFWGRCNWLRWYSWGRRCEEVGLLGHPVCLRGLPQNKNRTGDRRALV